MAGTIVDFFGYRAEDTVRLLCQRLPGIYVHLFMIHVTKRLVVMEHVLAFVLLDKFQAISELSVALSGCMRMIIEYCTLLLRKPLVWNSTSIQVELRSRRP